MNDDRSNERVESVVGDSIRAENASWTFSNDVAQTFADHVRKSIPMYDEGHDLMCKISDFFLGADSICYDLGTSTGTLLERLARHNSNKSVHFVGIDAEKSMIDKAKSTAPRSNNIQYVVEDIANYNFEQPDMMVSYYTMQFIHPKKRQLVIDKVYIVHIGISRLRWNRRNSSTSTTGNRVTWWCSTTAESFTVATNSVSERSLGRCGAAISAKWS